MPEDLAGGATPVARRAPNRGKYLALPDQIGGHKARLRGLEPEQCVTLGKRLRAADMDPIPEEPTREQLELLAHVVRCGLVAENENRLLFPGARGLQELLDTVHPDVILTVALAANEFNAIVK